MTTIRMAAVVALFGRVGFATRSVLYALLGGLACRYAATGRGRPDFAGTLTTLHSAGGSWVLIVAALGLWGYAMWRWVEAIRNPERRSVWSRQQIAMRGAMHAWLGVTAAHLALVHSTEPRPIRQWVTTALTFPLGRVVVFATGLGLAWCAWSEVRLAHRGVITTHLDGGEVSQEGLAAIHGIGRIGMLGRAVSFGLIAAAILAASRQGPRNVDLADIFASLCGTATGRLVVFAVGTALAAYGTYLGVLAWRRRVPA